MSLGDEWASITPGSASKLNRVTVTYGTGAYLAGLDKTKHKLVVCTSTGSGLTIDHLYLADSTGTTWIDLSTIAAHTHTSSTDGGQFYDILNNSSDVMDLCLLKTDDLKKAQWIETVTSTGSIEDKTDGSTGERSIRLRTNATSGATATISYPYLKMSFGINSTFTTKLQVETASSIALHTGVGADDTSAADSNTRKYNAEVCTATNNNWFLRSADGTTNSTSDSGTAFTANRVSIQIQHFPTLGTPRLDMYVDGGTVFQKTTNIPTSSTTTNINLIKHSVKNSTAADRPLLMYGCRLSFVVSGDSWF